ncbi:M48 family metallopeptidase [Brevibacillus choshinensis]|uniref:M48 family metallopeptidase n=1 Tax=Brevibacillus choshinensis TaxID=54911 RepID=UPI002E22C945|nr:M48 family metallopeptidase [Brevibacillus choshinensis]
MKMRHSYGQSLFKELQKHPDLLTKKGMSERVASMFSLVIICCSVVGFLLSLYGLINWYSSPLIVISCVLILLIAWLSRPRPNAFPKKVILLNSDQHPNAMKLFETITEKMGIKKGIQFALSPHYQAYTTEYGWSRKRIVVIGYPLFFACKPGELTALLAHELAHCRNNDVRRSGLVAHAYQILLNWCDMLDPVKNDEEEFHYSFLAMLSRGIMRLLFCIPHRLLSVLIHLFWNQSQRAEYEADRIAAQFAGSQQLISLLHNVHLKNVYEALIGRHSIQKQSKSLGEALHETFSNIPPKEKARIQRMLERNQDSMDTTHPATHLRIAMLQRNDVSPLYEIPEGEYERVYQEITKHTQEKMEHRMIDDYRAQLS